MISLVDANGGIKMTKGERSKRIKHIDEAIERVPTLSNKCRYPNIGQRDIYESLHGYPEVVDAIKEFCKLSWVNKPILVGGMAVAYWARNRRTEDADFMFLTESRLLQSKASQLNYFTKFKTLTDHMIEHKKTGVTIDLLTPEFIKLPKKYAGYIYRNSVMDSEVRIASIEGLILMKLNSGRTNDLGDIEMLLENPLCDLSKISSVIQNNHREVLDKLKPHDQLMWQ